MQASKQPNKALAWLLGADDKVELGSNYAAAILIFLMMWANVVQALFRHFSLPTPGVYEFIEIFMVGTVYFAIAYTEKIGGHVKMDMFLNRLQGKTREVVEATYELIFLAAFGLIAWRSGVAAWTAYITGDITMGLITIPTWPARIMVPIGCFLLSIRLLRNIAHRTSVILGPSTVETKTGVGTLSDL